jgi:hypothetical protein
MIKEKKIYEKRQQKKTRKKSSQNMEIGYIQLPNITMMLMAVGWV